MSLPEEKAINSSGEYPENWAEISSRIRYERAEGQCECTGECALHIGKRCTEMDGQPAKYARGKVVLTVAHKNNYKPDCRDENLFALCNRCHLRYDQNLHIRRGKENRQSAGAANQLEIPS